MSRPISPLGAVTLAALVVLSVVAGSVAFTGSTAAVDGVSAETSLTPTLVDENTQTQYTFNYTFTGINTSENTTYTVDIPSGFSIDAHDVAVKNGTGAVVNESEVVSGTTITLVANTSTTTAYLNGTVTLTSPGVDTDQSYDVVFEASEPVDGSASTTATIDVADTTLDVSTVSQLDPLTVDEQTERRYTLNYSYTDVDTSGETTVSLSVPGEFTIESEQLVMKNASGGVLNSSATESANQLFLSATPSTSTVYLAGSVNLTSPAVPDGQETKDYTLEINGTDNDGDTVQATETVTVEFTGGKQGSPEFLSAIQYVRADGTPAVEVAFSEEIDNFAGNYALYVDGEGELTGAIQSVSEAQGRAVIELDRTYSREMTLRLESGIVDSAGNALSNAGNQTVTFAPTSVGAGGDVSAYKGSSVAVLASSTNTGVTLQGTDADTDEYFFDGATGTNSRIFVFKTDARALGDYEADIEGEGTASITVRTLGLSVSVADRNVTNLQTIEGTVSAQSGGREIRLQLLDDDGDTVAGTTKTESLSGQGEYAFSYNFEALALDPGDYTVRVTDTFSGISAETKTITVTEAGETEANVPGGVIQEHRGDVAAIPITLENTREATLTVGTASEGFLANVTVRDAGGNDRDGRVTVYFDTYAASTIARGTFDDENDLFAVSEDDEIVRGDVSINVSNLLDATTYTLSVSTEGRPTDQELLVLQERETASIRTWTAPQRRYGDLDEAADLIEAKSEWVTRDAEVAVGDVIVYEIRASGLEGVLDARGEDTVTSAFFAFANGSKAAPAAQFTVAQADPGPNRQPLLLQYNSSNARVIPDAENDTYYVVSRTGRFGPSGVRDADGDGAIDPGENTDGTVGAEDDLRASFTVFGDDENDLDLTATGDDETVETTYSLTAPELTMTEPFNVTAASGQEIYGEATVAPGTELTLRVRSDDNVRPAFLKTATATVGADGQFLVTLSFNDTSPGDAYTITVSDLGPAPELQVDGTVQPVIPTATTQTPQETTTTTATPTPDTTTATPTPDTTTPATQTTTMTPFPTVQTPTTTPGFGVVAALLALGGAALLALRRG
ncbi:MAG: BGTF surface domain-containing protein [Haloquadratum sp.]